MHTLYGSLFTPDDVHLVQYVGALSLPNNGVTCVLDHCHIVNSPAHADAAVDRLMEAEIRGMFCYGQYENSVLPGQGQDQPAPVFDLDRRKWDALRARLFPIWDPEKSLLTFGFAPREPEGQGIDDTVADLRVARALGSRIITMHVAMGHYDTRHARVVQNLAGMDLLAPDFVFSHGASFTDGETELGSSGHRTQSCRWAWDIRLCLRQGTPGVGSGRSGARYNVELGQ